MVLGEDVAPTIQRLSAGSEDAPTAEFRARDVFIQFDAGSGIDNEAGVVPFNPAGGQASHNAVLQDVDQDSVAGERHGRRRVNQSSFGTRRANSGCRNRLVVGV
jgi:hypothetical protein